MNPQLKKLITVLQDGELHSGEMLGKHLSITRAAVWKLIKQLEHYHIEIEAKTNSGYRIPGGINLFDLKKIKAYLKEPYQNIQIEAFDEVDSTNTYLQEQAKIAKQFATQVCLAEQQNSGRGRLGRNWFSPYGSNIYCSILYYFNEDWKKVPALSIIIGLAIIKVLETLDMNKQLKLKWPNDIYFNNAKLGGILIEVSGETHHFISTIIGIGLNIKMPKHSKNLLQRNITDLADIYQRPIDKNNITALLINQILDYISIYQNDGLGFFIDMWPKYDLTLNKPVILTTPSENINGIARGLNDQGYLIIETQDSKFIPFSYGEVSLNLHELN